MLTVAPKVICSKNILRMVLSWSYFKQFYYSKSSSWKTEQISVGLRTVGSSTTYSCDSIDSQTLLNISHPITISKDQSLSPSSTAKALSISKIKHIDLQVSKNNEA